MKCTKIGKDVYVDGILQKDVVDLRADSWMKSVVEGKQYIFHVDTIIFAETDSFEMIVDESNSSRRNA